jgi:hypothetical protein
MLTLIPTRCAASERIGSHIAAAMGDVKPGGDGPANVVPLRTRKGVDW